jgi:hypothetical protein
MLGKDQGRGRIKEIGILPIFCQSQPEEKKETITCLKNNGEVLVETKSMLEHALDFYKTLFSKENSTNIGLGDDFLEEDERVSDEENLLLEVDLSEEEIMLAIKGSCLDGAQVQMDSPSCSTKNFGQSSRRTSWPWLGALIKGT